jgi:gliding motility-associated-like protein
VDDYDTTDFQAPVTINVLSNDSDPENSVLHISFCGYPSNGLVTANSDGSITYTPYAGFSGDDQFCYFICDNGIPVLCDTASVYIHVLPLATIEDVFVYNGFSPNGDGNNDFLVIKGIEGFPENEIFIYNRYGDKIRGLSHYNNHDVIWDGSNTDGKPVPDGTYFYVLKIKDQPAKTGWIFIRGKK